MSLTETDHIHRFSVQERRWRGSCGHVAARAALSKRDARANTTIRQICGRRSPSRGRVPLPALATNRPRRGGGALFRPRGREGHPRQGLLHADQACQLHSAQALLPWLHGGLRHQVLLGRPGPDALLGSCFRQVARPGRREHGRQDRDIRDQQANAALSFGRLWSHHVLVQGNHGVGRLHIACVVAAGGDGRHPGGSL